MAAEDEVLAGRAYVAAHGRRRPRHAVANDLRLRLEAVSVINTYGWDDFSLNRVSVATGIAKAAIYRRYPSKSALGIHAWQRDLFPEFCAALEAAFRSAIEPGQQVPDARAFERDQFCGAMESFARPSAQLAAAVELLMASIVHPDLAADVYEPMRDWLATYCPLGSDGQRALRSTQAVAILTWALGLVIFSDRPWVAEMDLTPALSRAYGALTQPAPARPLPSSTAGYLRMSPFHTDDPRIDVALDHASASIGSIGYQRTRLQDVAKAAGVSEAFLLIRFTNKIGMFRMINDTNYASSYESFSEFQRATAAEYGSGVAEAVAWREYLNPAIRDRQIMGLETDRLARHDQRMRDIVLSAERSILDQRLQGVPPEDTPARVGDTHLDFATGHGLPLVGLLLPHAWSLPLSTLTEPYMAAHPYQ